MPVESLPRACPYCLETLAEIDARFVPPVAKCGRCHLWWPAAASGAYEAARPSGFAAPRAVNREHEREFFLWKKHFAGLFPGGTVLDVGSADGSWMAARADRAVFFARLSRGR